MDLSWLKRPMPRSLYGRAALILIVPIVTIQLVVSIVFIQRHFEDVTQQMTSNLLVEVGLLLRQIDEAPTPEDALAQTAPLAEALQLEISAEPDGPTQDSRLFYDLSGRVVIATMRQGVEGVRGIDLRSDDKEVRLSVDTRHGPVDLRFDRRRVSASNPHQLLVLMIFTGLLMTLIAILFLRNQLRPIRRLAFAATEFGKGRMQDYRPAGALSLIHI